MHPSLLLPHLADPCKHPSAIGLPGERKCLIPVTSALSWTDAQLHCEANGGALFKVKYSCLSSYIL